MMMVSAVAMLAVVSGEVPRVSNLTRDEFDRLARTGKPFIITDGARDMPMKSWDCDVMSEKFSGVRLRREYGNSEVNNHDFGGGWRGEKVPITGRKLPEGAPKFAPFYSDLVKAWRGEAERKWGKKSKVEKMEKEMHDATTVPYFMDPKNLPELRRNPEFWLQPPETGSMAHMDEHCITTIATTLSGTKRWRFMDVPAKPHPRGYFDGLVYDRDEWAPDYEVVAHAGESVIFPPGMIHEGLSVGEDCVSSITWQFPRPSPVGYWRAMFPRLRRTKDMHGCIPLIASFATLNDPGRVPLSREAALADGRKIAKETDRDSDGLLSAAEVAARFHQGPRGRSFGGDDALDAWRYHDVDDDGNVTVDEFVETFAAWSSAEWQAREEGVVLRNPNDEDEDEGEDDEEGDQEL